jgi:hypothetical protein
MKSSYLRAATALSLAAALTACGGKASFDVSGSISGLSTDGLVLTNGTDTVSPKANAESFTFPRRISYGDSYTIVATTQPAHLTCVVGGATGTAGQFVSINASVTCTRNSHALTGNVTGLTSEGLVLINGSTGGSVTVLKPTDGSGNASFTLPSVADGVSYGVTVLTQPSNPAQFCTVINGTDVMHETDVGNILVQCGPVPTP